MHGHKLFVAVLLASATAVGFTMPVRSPAPVAAAPAQYEIDPTHSSILFRAKHLGVNYVYGRFNEFSGSVTYDAEKIEASKVSIKIATSSVDTGAAKRDDHLRSPDFLDAAQFPEAKFESKTVKKKDDKNFTVEGDLSLHGVTKPVKLDVEFVGAKNWDRFGDRAGFHGTFTFKRSDFGITFSTETLSDEVSMIVSLETAKAEAKK